ncbi:MAG: DUF3578 domain-containing protein, partial [Lachnospiraceae bacterium]|nr:DUF3578 domain-containing protein [Lachnospiraceae bacterium]
MLKLKKEIRFVMKDENAILHNLFRRVMSKYGKILKEVKDKNDYQNDFRDIIYKDIPNTIRDICSIETPYKVVGSYGKGRWTDVPWIAIFDERITTSARKGVYIVYLFNKDTQELFLTLNQGVTELAQNGITGEDDILTFKSISKIKNKETE